MATPSFDQAYNELYKGWDRTAAQNDFNAGGWKNKAGAEKYLNNGISSYSPPSAPKVDLNSIYSNAVNDANKLLQPSIDSSASLVNDIQKRIDEKRAALNKAEFSINDNPYFAEATRVGRIAKLRDAAQNELSLDTNQLSVAQDQARLNEAKLAQAKADAQIKVNIAANQYNIESTQYQNQVQMFNNLLTSGGFNNASQEELSQVAEIMGVNTSVINSIVTQSKKLNEPKVTLQTYDDGENQYVIAIKEDGTIVNRQLMGTKKQSSNTGVPNSFKSAYAGSDWEVVDNNSASSGNNISDLWGGLG